MTSLREKFRDSLQKRHPSESGRMSLSMICNKTDFERASDEYEKTLLALLKSRLLLKKIIEQIC